MHIINAFKSSMHNLQMDTQIYTGPTSTIVAKIICICICVGEC